MDDLFPYDEPRQHQEDMLDKVEEALQEGEHLVAHAPTGIGKTAATVAPSLAYGLANNKTTFFLTPRHSQHEIAIETLSDIRERHGTSFTSVDLIGKRWLCEGETGGKVFLEGEEEPSCPRHDNTYTDNHQLTQQAKKKIAELETKIMRAEDVKEACKKVCPYEILIHMAADADIIIGDYFHIFHPGVREAIFNKSQIGLDDCILINDEAHNLPDRTRSLNSVVLTEKMVQRASREASKYGFYEEEEKLDRLNKALQTLAKKELGMEKEAEIDKDAFTAQVGDIADYDSFRDDLGTVAKEVMEDGEESVCEDIAEFLDRWKGKDHGFVRVMKRKQGTGSSSAYLKLSYTCLDPQYATQTPLKQSHASVSMSGTLTPVDMYVDLFGLDDDTHAETYRSPFPEQNKISLIVDKVTTQYKERNDSMYQKIAWYILKSMEHIDGNAGVFFPSYSLMHSVYDNIKDRTDTPIFLEDRKMDKKDKNTFLDRFKEKTEEGAVLFGVMSGSFGEGVDFPGDLMSAVFIVGLPLQRPDLETQALIDFYEEKFGRGWDYAYNFPAVNRALQAAGRCIRSHEDRGVIVFMDKRYKWNKYRDALPEEDYRITKAPWNDIKAFFGT
jgi:DNA excision repair protein ERCC-2